MKILKKLSNIKSQYSGDRLWFRFRLFYRRLTALKFKPHNIARGLFVGIFIGFTPFLGFQILLAVLLATLIKANKVVAVLATFISNPLTYLPIFAFNLKTGKILLGVDSLNTVDYLDKPFSMSYIIEIGSNTMVPLVLGSLFIGTIVAALISISALYSYGYLHKKNLNIKRGVISVEANKERQK